MSNEASPAIGIHDDPELFREAVRFTAVETGFSARLVEKDYYCTVLLSYLAEADEHLVFKGGTCLAKVHGSFYRLSEDLDFTIPMAVDAPRAERSRSISRCKHAVAKLTRTLPCFQVTQTLRGANESTQYLGHIRYQSMMNRADETITLEISLREPLIEPIAASPARTILLEPITGQPMVPPRDIQCISTREAWAEKCRAALTRRDVAIRDFYDLDYAVRVLGVQLTDAAMIDLVRQKLAVAGNEAVDVSADRSETLRRQAETRLKPVLRPVDLQAFDVDRAFELVCDLADRLVDSEGR